MEAKTVHTATPTPWSYKQLTGAARGYAIFWSDNSKPGTWQRRVDQYSNIGPNGEFTEQDAAFIVRACNAHDDLVKALKALSNMYAKAWDRVDGGLFMDAAHIDTFEDLHAQAHAALAAAEQA